MSMTKTIEIDGRQVSFRASAAIPRIYRMKFHRDIYKDLAALEKAVGKGSPDESRLDMLSLEMFENIAYIMAKHADASVPDTPEEWLDGFGTFSIYQVLSQIIELWGLNVQTDVTSKKNPQHRAADDHAAVPAPLRTDRAVPAGSGFADHRDGERYVCGEQERQLRLPRGRHAERLR